jgi:hypothetical protein
MAGVAAILVWHERDAMVDQFHQARAFVLEAMVVAILVID